MPLRIANSKMESYSFAHCVEVLTNRNSMREPLQVYLSKIASADIDTFSANEGDSEKILHKLLELIAVFCRNENCTNVLTVVRCLHRANENDRFVISGAKIVLPQLSNLISLLLVRVGLFQSETLFPLPADCIFRDMILRFPRHLCISIAENLFELALDYVDVVSKSTEMYFRRLSALVVAVLFRSSPIEPKNAETEYLMDCLSRNASYVLCNVAEIFPSSHMKLYHIIKPHTIDLIRLSCAAPESSIRRSLIRVASILYRSRRRGLVQFRDIRRTFDKFLSSNFNDNIMSIFASINSESEDYDEQVEEFRESVSTFPGMNHCFVTPLSVVTLISGRKLKLNKQVRHVDWDEKSFVIRYEGMESLRFPFCFVTGIQWEETELQINTQRSGALATTVQVKFAPSLHRNSELVNRFRGIIQNRLVIMRERKISQALDITMEKVKQRESKSVSDKSVRTLFSTLSGDGTLLSKARNDNDRLSWLRAGETSAEPCKANNGGTRTAGSASGQKHISEPPHFIPLELQAMKQLNLASSTLYNNNYAEASRSLLSLTNSCEPVISMKRDTICGSISPKNSPQYLSSTQSLSNGSQNRNGNEMTEQSYEKFKCRANDMLHKEGITNRPCIAELNRNVNSDAPDSVIDRSRETDYSSLVEHVSHAADTNLRKTCQAYSLEPMNTMSEQSKLRQNRILCVHSKNTSFEKHDRGGFESFSPVGSFSNRNDSSSRQECATEKLAPQVRNDVGAIENLMKNTDEIVDVPKAMNRKVEKEGKDGENDFFNKFMRLLESAVKVSCRVFK